MNPERLAELQRQRALVREHLAWLDREIAAAGTAPSGDAAHTPEPRLVSPGLRPAEPADLDETYRPDPVAAGAQMRRGCLLLAFSVLLLGAVALTALYFLRYRDHPMFFVGDGEPAGPAKSAPSARTTDVPRK